MHKYIKYSAFGLEKSIKVNNCAFGKIMWVHKRMKEQAPDTCLKKKKKKDTNASEQDCCILQIIKKTLCNVQIGDAHDMALYFILFKQCNSLF